MFISAVTLLVGDVFVCCRGCYVVVVVVVVVAVVVYSLVFTDMQLRSLVSVCNRRRSRLIQNNCFYQQPTRVCVSHATTGVGKGVIGAVTLPASGVIDFGTHAFEGVHR